MYGESCRALALITGKENACACLNNPQHEARRCAYHQILVTEDDSLSGKQ